MRCIAMALQLAAQADRLKIAAVITLTAAVTAGAVRAAMFVGPPHVGSAQTGQLPPAQTAIVAGQVIESPSGRPIADATVTLSGMRQPPGPVLTDAQGRFYFAGLPAGTFSLAVTKPGHARAAAVMRSIPVRAGERVTDLKLRLVRLASVAGTVRDDAGDPVVGMEVLVFRRAVVAGRPRMARAGQAFTDDRGMYRAFHLPPGDVLVCACARSPIPFDGILLKTLASQPMQLLSAAARAVKLGGDAVTLDDTLRTFAPTFHPSSATTTAAARVTLAPGDEQVAVDITVVPVRAVRVSGTITGAPGPLHASSIRLIPAGESEEAPLAALAPALVQPDGRFDFAGVPPGQYVLRVTHAETTGGTGGPSGAALAFLGSRGAALSSPGASVPASPQHWAAEPIVVGDDDVSGVSVSLREGPRVIGRVQFVGNRPPPEPKLIASRALVRLELTGSNPTFTGWVPMGRVGEDGAFTLSGLPGRQLLWATGVPGWTSLKSITAAGVDITDMPLELGARDLTDVLVTFVDGPMASIAGTVTGARALADDPVALVFPADRRLWANPDAARRRFRTVAVRRDGTFTASSLPAGDYLVVILPEDAVLDWQEAARLETLAPGAERLTLADGERKTLEVRR
jgi:hypothetical protein